MGMTYTPEENDYVKWNDLEGWIYFKSDEYITIEIDARHKNCDQLLHGTDHKKDHILVVCYSHYWNELNYVKSRKSKMDTES